MTNPYVTTAIWAKKDDPDTLKEHRIVMAVNEWRAMDIAHKHYGIGWRISIRPATGKDSYDILTTPKKEVQSA